MNNDINEKQILSESGVDFYYLLGVMWRYKKFIISFTFLSVILSIIYALTAPKQFESVVSLYPITKEQGGPIKELAVNLGLGVKPEGYYLPDVILSRRISKEVIYSKYKTEAFKDSVNLIQFWEFDQSKNPESIIFEMARNTLLSTINVKEDKETTLITLTVLSSEKKLSKDIAEEYCKAITKYLQEELRNQIRHSIKFTDERLNEVFVALIKAENELVEFQQRNAKATSPNLVLEMKKKYKEIDLAQNTELLLRRQLELLRIEEVRMKPVMNILDRPNQYDKHVKPQKRRIVMVSTILAFFLSYGLVLLKEKAEREKVIQKLFKEMSIR